MSARRCWCFPCAAASLPMVVTPMKCGAIGFFTLAELTHGTLTLTP
jgi:hypothetical protein